MENDKNIYSCQVFLVVQIRNLKTDTLQHLAHILGE